MFFFTSQVALAVISLLYLVLSSLKSTNLKQSQFHQKSQRRRGMGDRRVGVAVDFSECGKKALKWALDNVVRKGDYLILVTVLPEGSYEDGDKQLWIATGTPLIPLTEFSDPVIMHKYGVKPDPETLDMLNTAAKQKEIVVVSKIYYGDAREKICDAIDNVSLSCLVIGNRGLGKLKRVIMGSVSSYVVNNASCPVTVVKHHDEN